MDTQPSFTDSLLALIPQTRAFARALTRNSPDADDLVQETLTKALRYQEQFTPGTQLRAWLFTIMRNAHFTAIKKARRESPGAVDCVSTSLQVDPVHDAIIEHRQLMAAIARLPVQYREMLILVVMLGESYENAAVICNCAVGTVKSRVNRARRLVIDDLTSGNPPIGKASPVRRVAPGLRNGPASRLGGTAHSVMEQMAPMPVDTPVR